MSGGYRQLNQGSLMGSSWGMAPTAMAPMAQMTPAILPEIPEANPMPAEGSWWDRLQLLDSTDVDGVKTQGALLPGIGAAQGVFNAWLGMKQYGLAKQSLAEGKQQFGMNYDAQRSITNAQLEDRQRARVASNAGAYQSVGDYMSNYGIKPRG